MQLFDHMPKRHELKVQELRDERRKEQQRLEKLRASLQHKIDVKSESAPATIRVA